MPLVPRLRQRLPERSRPHPVELRHAVIVVQAVVLRAVLRGRGVFRISAVYFVSLPPSLALVAVFDPCRAPFCCALWCDAARPCGRSAVRVATTNAAAALRRLATPPLEGRSLDSSILDHAQKKEATQLFRAWSQKRRLFWSLWLLWLWWLW